jgi:DNA polymerase-3 subunit epsilon
MHVFNRLLERLNRLDLDTLMHVSRLSLPLNWPLALLFSEAERQRTRELLDGNPAVGQDGSSLPSWLEIPLEPTGSRGAPPSMDRPVQLDLDELERVLRTGGDIATQLDGFEDRSEQIEMLRAVAQAFNDSENLLVEAGTGIGKSLAYLLPAAHFAITNNCRVVVSTNTINLQDQLFHKELPSLKGATGLPLRYTVLKGRANYLCLRRWIALLHSEELAPEERSLLIKTLLWLPHTRTGDRAELRLAAREEEAWTKICALADACSAQHCAYNRAGRCFLARARRAAESSHLVVINHSLLLADLTTGSRALPEYAHLVIDEAHHLEDEATAQLGWRLGARELVARLERLGEAGPSPAAGLVSQVVELLRKSSWQGEQPALDRLRAELAYVVADLRDELPTFFGLLSRFVLDHGQRSDGGAMTVRLSAASRAQPAWSNVEIAWDDHNRRLLRLLRAMSELSRAVESADDRSDEWEALTGDLALQAAFWDVARQHLCIALTGSDPTTVAWLSLGRSDEVHVNAAPLHVADRLRTGLFEDKQCVILTSATLTTEQSFDYVRERLGLEDARELMLGSPFDYRRAALLLLPSDIPEPNSPGYQRSVEGTIFEIITALEGRTLVLFTSYSQLRATYEALKEPLERRQIVLLGQRMDGASRARLLESFKAGHRVALMGTTSFWEGIDVVGEALSCLVIARLPFTIPSDPVFQARSEAFEDPFGQYAVPQAVLRFRQGFGRLIRSRADRGVVVVLDRRLRGRTYGRAFLNSLPGCDVREGPAKEAATAAREWLRAAAAPAMTGV